MNKRTVCINLVGTVMDKVKFHQRWDRWGPTVSLCQQEDLIIDRLELVHTESDRALTAEIEADIATISPETTKQTHEIEWIDPWDFEEVYVKLHDFCQNYPFNLDEEDYLVHLTTGTHVAQICW